MTWIPADAQVLAKIDGWLATARHWAHSYYVIDVKRWSPDLVQDLYLDAMSDLAKRRVTPAQVTEVVGAALGQMFVTEHGSYSRVWPESGRTPPDTGQT